MRQPGELLILSCYELGHQPLAAASALAFLERPGYQPTAQDLSVERLDESRLDRARFVGISVPMHTALRLGLVAARKVRERRRDVHICFYGLYATLNAAYLLAEVADSVIGGEFEVPLVELVQALERGADPASVAGVATRGRTAGPHLERLNFPPPSRTRLPGLERYARLEQDGVSRLAAAVETSRGCLHHCRHCPIPPVYDGRFFVVPKDVVLEDIRRLVASGATHITFADPDFLNGPTHSLRIVRAMHDEHPELTFDFTTKIEHILKHRRLLPEMASSGCLFVISAVESLSDVVLEHLRKGHTRRDVFEALEILRDVGIALRPSLVAFTPWTTLDDYEDVVDWIEREGLIHHVDPVQLSIRLLVPPGSPLIGLPAMRPHLRRLEQENFSYAWQHPDPRMDELHRTVTSIVQHGALAGEQAEPTFVNIRRASAAAAGRPHPLVETRTPPARIASRPPRITEPWFC